MKSPYYEVFTKTQSRAFFVGMLDECEKYAEAQRQVWKNATLRIEKDGKVIKTYPPVKPSDYSKRGKRKPGELTKKEFNQIVEALWVRQDTFQAELPIKRWHAFKSLLRGKVKIRWVIPATQKDKRLKLKGKRLW